MSAFLQLRQYLFGIVDLVEEGDNLLELLFVEIQRRLRLSLSQARHFVRLAIGGRRRDEIGDRVELVQADVLVLVDELIALPEEALVAVVAEELALGEVAHVQVVVVVYDSCRGTDV